MSVFIFKDLVYLSTHFSMFCNNKLFRLQQTKLKQFSVKVLLNLDRSFDISQQQQFSILSSLKIVLKQKNHDQKNKPQIILKERTAHLASYKFLQETLINVTCHFHSSINHQEHFFHRACITSYFHPVNIAKFLKTAFLYTSRSFFCTPPALVLESFFKKKA